MKQEVEKPKPQVPFFVRFLEQQEVLVVQTDIKAGRTLKYPSDTDEDDP